MKFTLSWLKDHLETQASLTEICDGLTRIGLEVEGVENPAEKLKDFIIAHVVEAVQHPNADRLRVCQVDVGGPARIQVVCGAPNARAGLKTVFSPPGTYIPAKDITIAKGVIRGVESAGMLCSAAELELSGDHDGIIELAADAPVGAGFAAFAGIDDPVIEINLTPNRPDAAGVAGIARDLAAAGLGRLKTPPAPAIAGGFACPVDVKLDFAKDEAHLAPLFALRLIKGVKNGPSPEWMQKRLTAIGLRPINALVDITNYMTFDRGRPLHVFDADKVKGDLVVRRAKAGEEVLALDGKTYKLTGENVVIADDTGVESIAGVMGGEHSGCSDHTTNVLVESALWDPYNIARTGRDLGIVTDARYRFERGVDPDFTVSGAELATQWILDMCGGAPSALVVAGEAPKARAALRFRWSEVERLTGLKLEPNEMAAILEKLGFEVARTESDSNIAIAHIPSWRPDVEGAADLVEEIVRIAGLERVSATPLSRAHPGVAEPVLTLGQRRVAGARRTLAARGLMEAVTYSFISQTQARLFGGGAPALKLSNPIAADMSDMRPSLLPGLLAAAQRNADRGFGDLALFEVGQIFKNDTPEGQIFAAASLRRGTAHAEGAGRSWAQKTEAVGVFDAKADALALLAGLGVAQGAVQLVASGPDYMHPGRSARLQFGPKNIVGAFGEIHPRILDELKIEGPLAVFEIALDAIPAPKAKPTKARGKLELSAHMPLERDFAFLVDRSVAAADLMKAVAGADRALIVETNVFDVYQGAGVPQDKKSVALSVRLQPRDKTLTEAEIDAVAQKIVAEAAKKTGAVLRG